jgi:AraC family transcriptional regulator, ethanolamine operon transcriptional activator
MVVAPGLGGHPAVSVVDLSDPTVAGQGFELLAQDAVKLSASPLHVRRVTVRLGDATVVSHSNNLPIRTETTNSEGLLAYATFSPLSTGTVDGLPVSPGLLLAAGPGAQVRLVSDAGWQSILFLLRPEYLAEQLSARRRAEEFDMPRGLLQRHASVATVQRLFEWGRRLVDTAAAEPEPFNHSADRRAAAQVELVETLLTTLRETEGREPDRQDLARKEQTRIVKIAENHALAHAAERLYVSELCRVTAVSERTLEYAFKGTLGLTPVAYLARLRLHRVRHALQTETPGSRTVSAVALDWGFWHFGEFSRAYKECFGELPSETLRGHRLASMRQAPC